VGSSCLAQSINITSENRHSACLAVVVSYPVDEVSEGEMPLAKDLVPSPLPDRATLFLETPLYETFAIPSTAEGRGDLLGLRYGTVQFDAYCVHCRRHSPFKTSYRSFRADADQAIKDGTFEHTIECQRHPVHKYVFHFRLNGMRLTKIGQFPSIADLASADIEKYRPLLKTHFGELSKATGLASHGVGIGAFVYLRRIFERLIQQHHDELPAPVEDFGRMRMDEKIGALKSVLPPALVRNKATYSILSKGLHELDEETCKAYFPVVRAAIIQILEQDFQARDKKLAEEKLEAEIAKIAGELSAKSLRTD